MLSMPRDFENRVALFHRRGDAFAPIAFHDGAVEGRFDNRVL